MIASTVYVVARTGIWQELVAHHVDRGLVFMVNSSLLRGNRRCRPGGVCFIRASVAKVYPGALIT
jgi:hypothetical protein